MWGGMVCLFVKQKLQKYEWTLGKSKRDNGKGENFFLFIDNIINDALVALSSQK